MNCINNIVPLAWPYCCTYDIKLKYMQYLQLQTTIRLLKKNNGFVIHVRKFTRCLFFRIILNSKRLKNLHAF